MQETPDHVWLRWCASCRAEGIEPDVLEGLLERIGHRMSSSEPRDDTITQTVTIGKELIE